MQGSLIICLSSQIHLSELVRVQESSSEFEIKCFEFLPDRSTLSNTNRTTAQLGNEFVDSDSLSAKYNDQYRGARALYDGIPGRTVRVCRMQQHCNHLLSRILNNLRHSYRRPQSRGRRHLIPRDEKRYECTLPTSLGRHIRKLSTQSTALRGDFHDIPSARRTRDRFAINHFVSPERSSVYCGMRRRYEGENISRAQLRRRRSTRYTAVLQV